MSTNREKWITWWLRMSNQNTKTISKTVKRMAQPTFNEMRKALGLFKKSKKSAAKELIDMKHFDECI